MAEAFRLAPPDLRRRAADFAAEWALARSGLAHPVFANGSADQVAALVVELDERYFAVAESREVGQATTEGVVVTFSQARAANAVELLLRGELAEAIYEAAAAAEDWSELRASVLSLLVVPQNTEPSGAAAGEA